MAKLKGGSYVAGQLTVEDAVVANAYLTDAGTMMVSVAAGSVPAANTIVKIGSAEGDLIASILTEVDSVLTITGDSVTLGASTVRTLKLADAGIIANPDLSIVSASSLSTDRMLTIDVVDADRTLQLAANLAIASGNVTINGAGTGSTLTLPEASISINSINNGNVLYASAANTISGEASLSPTRGGTGLVAPAIFSILYGNSTDAMGLVAPNTEDIPKAMLMTGTGTAGAAPIWSVIPNAALEYSYVTINGTDVSLGEAIEIDGGAADLGTVLAHEASELGVAYESTDYYTHSKHAIAYGRKIGEILMFQDRRTPVTWAEARSTANPTSPEYFPVIPRYDGNHDITTAQAPLLVAELIDKVITVGSTTTFSGTLVSGVIVLQATIDNDHLLIALIEAAMVLRWHDTGQDADFATLGGLYTGTGQYCLRISGTNYAITGVDAVAREIYIASPPADGAVDFTVPQYGVPGSTTSIRLRQLSGFVPVACGDYDGEILEGLVKMDRIQGHRFFKNPDNVQERTLSPGGTLMTSLIASNLKYVGYTTTGDMTTDGIHGAPRKGKTTDPRSFGVAIYTWARTLLARDWM